MKPMQRTFCRLAAAATLFALLGCKVPEKRQALYANGAIKERYWVYEDGGREVMHGLYAAFYPSGKKEVEIVYKDGAEITKTYYNENGRVIGVVNVAAGENRE